MDQLLADEQLTGGEGFGAGGGYGYDLTAPGDVLFALTDHLGTVRDLATYDNGVTSIANHRVYDSFGNLKSETNAAVDCLFGFTGRAYDENSGLQNNLNRWYDSKTGSWVSEDPIGFNGSDANLYRYVGNSPTNTTDPLGLATQTDAVRQSIVRKSWAILCGLVSSRTISVTEAKVRQQIVCYALRSKMAFFEYNPAWTPNPNYWKGDYSILPGKNKAAALRDIYDKSWVGCKAAAGIIFLLGFENTLTGSMKKNLDQVIGTNPLPNLFATGRSNAFLEYKEDKTWGFTVADLKPGDWIWVNNPKWQKGDKAGHEGSNAFYVGDGKFVDVWGKQYYTYDRLIAHVATYEGSGSDTRRPYIERIRSPKVP